MAGAESRATILAIRRLETARILTTHVGSLPRRRRTADPIFARERGEPCDAAAFD